MMFIPETPSYLYSSRRWKELHACFDTFTYINQGEKLELKFEKEEKDEEVEEKEEGSLKNLLCEEKSRFLNLLLMVLNW